MFVKNKMFVDQKIDMHSAYDKSLVKIMNIYNIVTEICVIKAAFSDTISISMFTLKWFQ